MERRTSTQDMLVMAIGFGLVLSTIFFFILRNTSDDNSSDNRTMSETAEGTFIPPMMDVEQVRPLLAKGRQGLTVVDLRPDAAYAMAHAAGSVHAITPEQLSVTDLPDGNTFLLISSEDIRTDRMISESLTAMGKPYAFMKNSLMGWQASGGAMITEPDFSSPIDRSKVTFVTVEEWKSMFEKKDITYRIVDIRPRDTSTAENVAGSIVIPYDEIESRRGEIPFASNIALCGSDAEHAFMGAVRLFDLGFFSVKALDGSCTNIEG
ncbi:MAG: rhodanese-like domain-containing protein [Candidatus Moranbacteria bacterium]|nr:rhodanese-like domain-containing protein [Candidatus Moranbacteria bacterium]